MCNGVIKAKMKPFKLGLLCLIYGAVVSLLSACGGGGGTAGDAESSLAPRLLAAPTIGFSPNSGMPTEFDLTVSIEADGPSGIYSASVWVEDETGANVAFIDLSPGGGNSWSGITNPLIPLPAGTYRVIDVVLHDADPVGSAFRSGWFFEMPVFSSSHYYVDQRDVYSNPNFDLIANGVSSIPIMSFPSP